MIANGVASPNAHGQEITSTEIATLRANSNVAPHASQTIAVTRAMPMTTGTNIPLTLSASLPIGAFDEAAFFTSSTICESVVSSPTRRAFILNAPLLTMEAEISCAPTFFSTGILSPVSADSSTVPPPSVTSPSTGTELPGLSKIMSPTAILSTVISTSSPSRKTSAVLGARSMSFCIAE